MSLFNTRVKVDNPGSIPDIYYKALPVDSSVIDNRYGDSSSVRRVTRRAPTKAKEIGSRRRRKRRGSSTDISDACDSSACSNDIDSLSDYNKDLADSIDVNYDSTIESTAGYDLQSITDDEAASYTDDDYNSSNEETSAFLYRYFIIFLVKNLVAGKPNNIFIKAILLYTKGEEKNPRI